MSFTPKHLATFLLGAAAGAAILKYNTMTPEEQEKLVGNIKEKANQAKTEAEGALANLETYFEELKGKGMEALKTHAGEAEGMMNELFAKIKNATDTKTV
jgi:hypothetical protein